MEILMLRKFIGKLPPTPQKIPENYEIPVGALTTIWMKHQSSPEASLLQIN